MKESFDDRVANRMVNGMLYLLLVVFLAREVEWLCIASSLLLGVLSIWLIVRIGMLFFGKIEAKRRAGQDDNPGWWFPGYMFVYALVAYTQGFELAAAIFLGLAVVCLSVIGLVLIGSKRES